MRTQVKICGLTRPEDVEAAIRYGADYLGFIVEAPSKRRLSVSQATKLSLPAKGIIPRVAVTVNADDEVLSQIMTDMQPDYIQLHGDEDVHRVAKIAKKFKVRTIKAIAIATQSDLITAAQFAGVADMILLDAKPPAGSDVRGGHGITIDWSIIKTAPLPKTYLLAGGLRPDNAAEALAITHAPILDVSSGVETSPGIKDRRKIKTFIASIKSLADK